VSEVTAQLGGLCRLLRAHGVRVGTAELLAAHRALAAIDPGDARLARVALRATLCSRREDLAAFDDAFAQWRDGALADPVAGSMPPELDEALRQILPRTLVPSASALVGVDAEIDAVPAAYSDVELLLDKDFASYTDAERALAHRLLAQLAVRGPWRPTRRLQPARRGEHLDLRATLRAARRTGGEPFALRVRGRRAGLVPLVLVADVSGSMEHYSRMGLMYLQAVVSARGRAEAFAFATRLTRVTRELRGRDHDAALARATAAVLDVHGGTRIGDAIAELNREHGRILGRGATVVIMSDGWDRGDPEQLAAELARLRRCARRLVWLNPLAADPRWEPLTRGMAAAVPHVDHLLPGNTLRSLSELADLLESGL